MGKKEKREEEEKKKIEGEEEEKEEREEEEEKEDSESEEEEKKEEEKEDKKESKAKVSDKRGITKAEEIREAMELCILADYSLIQARSLINSSKSIIELRSKIINAKANSFEEKATLPTQSLKTESCRSLSTIAKNIYQI